MVLLVLLALGMYRIFGTRGVLETESDAKLSEMETIANVVIEGPSAANATTKSENNKLRGGGGASSGR